MRKVPDVRRWAPGAPRSLPCRSGRFRRAVRRLDATAMAEPILLWGDMGDAQARCGQDHAGAQELVVLAEAGKQSVEGTRALPVLRRSQGCAGGHGSG